jgi:hypothetical protein
VSERGRALSGSVITSRGGEAPRGSAIIGAAISLIEVGRLQARSSKSGDAPATTPMCSKSGDAPATAPMCSTRRSTTGGSAGGGGAVTGATVAAGGGGGASSWA